MQKNGLRDLLVDELRDLYDAENRLLKALPKMAKASNSPDLRSGFEHHLEQTRGHVDRLDEIFESLEEKPSGRKCAGMMGLIKEGDEMMDEDFEGAVMDAALISAAQRVEHYEIGAYGCVKTWAELLGEDAAAALLDKTMDEEKETDHKLTELSREINAQAKETGGQPEQDEERTGKRTRAARAGG